MFKYMISFTAWNDIAYCKRYSYVDGDTHVSYTAMFDTIDSHDINIDEVPINQSA